MTTTTNATKLALPWISSTFKSTTTPAILEKAMENVPMWALLVAGFFGVQIVAVVLNVLRQLVLPKDPNLPPEVFHFYPIIGSAISYGNDPINFFFKCREQYGEVFTFVLLGRKVTVALGPKGNDMILGGKPNVVSAEAAYTHLTTPVFGKHVVYDCPNETLMQQKKFVKFGLNTDNFRAYMGMIEDETSMFMSTDPNFTAIHSKTREWGRFNSFKSMSELTILTPRALSRVQRYAPSSTRRLLSDIMISTAGSLHSTSSSRLSRSRVIVDVTRLNAPCQSFIRTLFVRAGMVEEIMNTNMICLLPSINRRTVMAVR